MRDPGNTDSVIIVHHAATSIEAMVIRGLLESAGIEPVDFVANKPLTMHAHPTGFAADDIAVFASEAEDARRIIAEYLSSGEGTGMEHSDGEPGGSIDD
jgi:hypothetical protein